MLFYVDVSAVPFKHYWKYVVNHQLDYSIELVEVAMPDSHTRKSSSFVIKETRDHHLLLYLQHRTTSKFLQIIFFDGVNDLDQNSKGSKLQYWNWHNWNYRTKSENDPIFSTLTILSKLYQKSKWILHSHHNPQTANSHTSESTTL